VTGFIHWLNAYLLILNQAFQSVHRAYYTASFNLSSHEGNGIGGPESRNPDQESNPQAGVLKFLTTVPDEHALFTYH
jgi:hypothetical protein